MWRKCSALYTQQAAVAELGKRGTAVTFNYIAAVDDSSSCTIESYVIQG